MRSGEHHAARGAFRVAAQGSRYVRLQSKTLSVGLEQSHDVKARSGFPRNTRSVRDLTVPAAFVRDLLAIRGIGGHDDRWFTGADP